MNTPIGRRPADTAARALCAELLLQELRSGVQLLIVDVRDRDEIDMHGAIQGARWFPLRQLGARVDELALHRSTPVVVVSQDGERSKIAVNTLAAAGFTEVMLLEGGMSRWTELGYPVELRVSARTRTICAPTT